MKSLGLHCIWLRSWANPLACSCRLWRGEQNKTMLSKASMVYYECKDLKCFHVGAKKRGPVSVSLSSNQAIMITWAELATQNRGEIVSDHHQHIEQPWTAVDRQCSDSQSNHDWRTEPLNPNLFVSRFKAWILFRHVAKSNQSYGFRAGTPEYRRESWLKWAR